MSHYSGITLLTPSEPMEKTPLCGACKTPMDGDWAHGPTGFAEAMAKKKHKHYRYACPNVDKDGHEHLVKLLKEHDKFLSHGLRRIVEHDLDMARKSFLEKLEEKK